MKIIDIKTDWKYLVFSGEQEMNDYVKDSGQIDCIVIFSKVMPKNQLSDLIFDTSEFVILNNQSNFGIMIIPEPSPSKEEILQEIEKYQGTVSAIISEQIPEDIGDKEFFKKIYLSSCPMWWYYNNSRERSSDSSNYLVEHDMMTSCNPKDTFPNIPDILDSLSILEGNRSLKGITIDQEVEFKKIVILISAKIGNYPLSFRCFSGKTNSLILSAERKGRVSLIIKDRFNIIIETRKIKSYNVKKRSIFLWFLLNR